MPLCVRAEPDGALWRTVQPIAEVRHAHDRLEHALQRLRRLQRFGLGWAVLGLGLGWAVLGLGLGWAVLGLGCTRAGLYWG